jgi:hypothetical protein
MIKCGIAHMPNKQTRHGNQTTRNMLFIDEKSVATTNCGEIDDSRPALSALRSRLSPAPTEGLCTACGCTHELNIERRFLNF